MNKSYRLAFSHRFNVWFVVSDLSGSTQDSFDTIEVADKQAQKLNALEATLCPISG